MLKILQYLAEKYDNNFRKPPSEAWIVMESCVPNNFVVLHFCLQLPHPGIGRSHCSDIFLMKISNLQYTTSINTAI